MTASSASTRNCLDCGTPKWGSRRKCLACQKKTLDYRGQARNLLCETCKHFNDGACSWFGEEENRLLVYIDDKLARHSARHSHHCNEYVREYIYKGWDEKTSQPIYDTSDPSPHPLAYVDREEIRSFLEAPSAFWLDPYRWDGIDETRTKFWMKGTKSSSPLGMVAIAAAVVVGLTLSPKKEAA